MSVTTKKVEQEIAESIRELLLEFQQTNPSAKPQETMDYIRKNFSRIYHGLSEETRQELTLEQFIRAVASLVKIG